MSIVAGPRDVRATAKQGGAFTKGNTRQDQNRFAEAWLAAMDPQHPQKRRVVRGEDRQVRGAVCPACGLERSLTGKCECNE